MKLEDIADMKDYLENRCYCPGEIYGIDGFFFQVFNAETECKMLFDNANRGAIHGKFVIAKAKEEYDPQIIYIEITENKVDDCIRLDATQHNILEIKKFLDGEIDKMSFDEYDPGKTAEALGEILSFADAVMCK